MRKRRGLKESCKTISPSSPNTTPSYLVPREQWLRETDTRTDEQADADWRRVTESIFGANTVANPTVAKQKEHCEHLKFVPNWGNTGISQELLDEEKRGAEEWATRSRADKRRAFDRRRDGGGSPLRGNQKSEIHPPRRDRRPPRRLYEGAYEGARRSLRISWMGG